MHYSLPEKVGKKVNDCFTFRPLSNLIALDNGLKYLNIIKRADTFFNYNFTFKFYY